MARLYEEINDSFLSHAHLDQQHFPAKDSDAKIQHRLVDAQADKTDLEHQRNFFSKADSASCQIVEVE